MGVHGGLCDLCTTHHECPYKASNVILYLYLNRSLNSFMTFGDKGKSTQITFIRKQDYSQQLALGFDCIGKMQGGGWGWRSRLESPKFWNSVVNSTYHLDYDDSSIGSWENTSLISSPITSVTQISGKAAPDTSSPPILRLSTRLEPGYLVRVSSKL